MCVWSLSHVWFFAAPWTVVHQTPLSMEFSKQDYWNGFPFPTPKDLPDSQIKRESPGLAGGFLTTSATWEAIFPSVYENPLQYSCLEKPHRQRSLRGYSPRAHKESDTNELLSTAQLQITSSSNWKEIAYQVTKKTVKNDGPELFKWTLQEIMMLTWLMMMPVHIVIQWFWKLLFSEKTHHHSNIIPNNI